MGVVNTVHYCHYTSGRQPGQLRNNIIVFPHWVACDSHVIVMVFVYTLHYIPFRPKDIVQTQLTFTHILYTLRLDEYVLALLKMYRVKWLVLFLRQ